MGRRPMTVLDHLEELRARILWTLIPWAICTAAALPLADDLLAYLARPVGPLYVTSPAEAMLTHLRLAVYLGAVLAAPVGLYQAVAFVLPALTPDERRLLFAVLPLTLLLFLAGVAFGFAVVMPVMLRFLLSFATGPIRPLITAADYLTFVASVTVPFGLTFELPAVVLLLARLGAVTAEGLRRARRYAVVAVLVLAGVLSPPDVVSQLLLAAPMLVLYEASAWLAGWMERRAGR